MYSLEELKELAVRQMRAAADLYELCENAEKDLNDNDHYNKCYLRSQRSCRFGLLESKYGIKPTEEEQELWDNVMEELD